MIIPNNSLQIHIKLFEKEILKKTAETTGDLIGNKIPDAVAKFYDGEITKISKISQRSNSEIVIIEYDKEIPKERYISRRKTENY